MILKQPQFDNEIQNTRDVDVNSDNSVFYVNINFDFQTIKGNLISGGKLNFTMRFTPEDKNNPTMIEREKYLKILSIIKSIGERNVSELSKLSGWSEWGTEQMTFFFQGPYMVQCKLNIYDFKFVDTNQSLTVSILTKSKNLPDFIKKIAEGEKIYLRRNESIEGLKVNDMMDVTYKISGSQINFLKR